MDETYPWLSGLNPVQREAALHKDGPLMIVAGAGSGKTRVIIHRMAHLLMGHGVDPSHILAVTFTNKAAEEMRTRVGRLLGASAGVWVSTFHSLGAQLLRQHIHLFGYSSSFSIFDDSDQTSLLKKVIKSQGYDPKIMTPKQLKGWVSWVKRNALTLDDLEKGDNPAARKQLPLLREYQDRLREANAVDFGDLLLLTHHLFARHPEILESYRERWRYVMIDEYQDTNRVQYLLSHQLAGPSQNICVVGDEDQSIYGWRGADIRNILSFEKDFPNARVIKLEQNYRSTSTIIEASSELIALNKERKPKRLWTENPPGGSIKLYEAVDERDEAYYVVEEVLREKGMGRSLRDMAVFYRTHAQSRVFEDILRKREVPYTVYGGTRFYDRKEIKDLLAYLRFLVNPADEVNLFRIINVPTRGIGAKTLSKLEEIKTSQGLDWMQALQRASEGSGLGPKSRAGLKRFYDLVQSFSHLVSGPPSPVVNKVIEDSGYKKMLEDEGGPEARMRLENLEELINAAAEYELESEDPSLAGFLEKVSLESDIDRYNPEEGSLILMTLHSAKGLEFPVVFMVGLEDGVFPHAMAVMEDNNEAGSRLEEERRLCYVGVTRAMEKLVISYAGSRILRGSRQECNPSPFLAEIPSSYFEKVRKGGALSTPQRKSQKPQKKRPSRVDYGDSELVYEDDHAHGSYEHPDGFTLHPGDAIYHRSYGEGVIKRFEESGERLKIVVKFGSKTKKFLARYAPLEPV